MDCYLSQEYPTIQNGSQDGTVFMPDFFISKEPEIVDKSWDGAAEKKFQRREINFIGDQVEKVLFEKLKVFLAGVAEKKTVMFHSFQNTFKGQSPEFDFLIVNGDHKFIACIECKTNGSACKAREVSGQLHKRFKFLNETLALKPDWTCVKSFFGLRYSPDAFVSSSFNSS